MPVRDHSLPARELALVLRNAGVRTGAYAGVALALAFTVWLYVANRIPSLESIAFQRNIAAAAVLGLFAAIPVVRFLRAPGNLLVGGLVTWSILTLTYRALCIPFTGLAERYSVMQVFSLGAVVYMLLATLSWVGSCLWKLRASDVSQSNHESHISHSNRQI